MKLSLRKSFRAIMKGCLTLASAFVIISVNSTCMGPAISLEFPIPLIALREITHESKHFYRSDLDTFRSYPQRRCFSIYLGFGLSFL